MVASSSTSVRKERKEVFSIQLISNGVGQPPFWEIPKIAYKGDPSGALSMIAPKVLMIRDVRCCYTWKVGSIGDVEIKDLYSQLCDDGVLREENKIIERKGLTGALNFPNVFKTKWIKIVLSGIHGDFIWLENGPIKITKRIINRVIGYPTLDRPKSMQSDSKEIIEKNTGAV